MLYLKVQPTFSTETGALTVLVRRICCYHWIALSTAHAEPQSTPEPPHHSCWMLQQTQLPSNYTKQLHMRTTMPSVLASPPVRLHPVCGNVVLLPPHPIAAQSLQGAKVPCWSNIAHPFPAAAKKAAVSLRLVLVVAGCRFRSGCSVSNARQHITAECQSSMPLWSQHPGHTFHTGWL
jgi:hypothetical protein